MNSDNDGDTDHDLVKKSESPLYWIRYLVVVAVVGKFIRCTLMNFVIITMQTTHSRDM